MNQFSPLFSTDSCSKSFLDKKNLFSSLFNSDTFAQSSKKLIISPKKFEKTVREKSFGFPEPELKDLCKKLDFSEASENTASVYSISDNENMELNEISSEELPEVKSNTDFSWLSSNSLKKIKPKKKTKNFNSEKNLTFIHKKKNFEDSLDLSSSKFEEEYVIIKTLCKGEMGTVYLCLRLKDKKKFAVKKTKFFSRKLDYDNINKFVKDIEQYSTQPGNEFIVKYVDFWLEEKNFSEKKMYKMNNRDMYIVTEYYPKGNLKENLTNFKKLYKNKMSYDFFWDVIFQMIVPINFLHKLGYIHSDIKPSNYLIMDNNQLLLNDFCLSIKERELKTNELEGDSIYISPELFYKNIGTISHKTDIYSLGLSILELLIDDELPKNGPIWQEMRNREIPSNFFDKIIILNNDFINRCKLIELIKDMTRINSEERPELDMVLNDVIKYPELYNRYKELKNGKYEKNILINIDNINNCNIFLDDNKEKENFKNVNTDINDNINKMFYKRSNSMENLL